MEKNLLKKSGKIAVIITFSALAFWFGFAKLSLGAYNEKTLTRQFLGEDSEVFSTLVIEVGTDTVARIIAGTSSMTLTGTSSYQYQPRIEYSGVTGKWSFKNSGGTETVAFGTLTAAVASGLATLDVNSKVVQNPASGTSTPGVSKTVMSNGTGKILDGWLSDNVTKLGTPTTDNISEGSTNKYYLDSRVNAAVGSLSVNTLSDVNITFNENDFVKIVGGVLVAGSSSVTVAFSEVTGSTSASQVPLISGLLGSATSSQMPSTLEVGTITTNQAIKFADNSVQAYASPILYGTSAVFTSTQTINNDTWTDVTNLSITLTPHSSNSKFMIMASLSMSTAAATPGFYQLVRNTTAIGIGDASSSRGRITGGMGSDPGTAGIFSVGTCYTDSPGTTTATTYKVQIRNQSGGSSVKINASQGDTDYVYMPRGISTLTILELAN